MYSQEQLDQIKVDNDARMASFSNKDTTTSVPDTGGDGEFIKAIQNQLLGQMDIVSSADTGIEQVANDSVKSLQDSQKAGASRIESDFDRKISNVRQSGADAFTTAQESQRGFAVNRIALQRLTESTDKQVKEYERMEQDALMQNNTQFASQISNIKFQAVQFQQQAQQQTFSNMMQVAGLGIQIRAEERAGQQFTQNLKLQRDQMESSKQSEMLGLAANAGIQLNPGETYESLSKRIANSDITRLQKEKLQIDINNAKEKNSSDISDLYAQQIITSEIADGQTVEQSVTVALLKIKELAGRELTTEESNRVVQMAILAKQQFNDTIAQDTNNSLQINDDIFASLARAAGLRYGSSFGINGPEVNTDTGDLPESLRQGDKPNQTGLSDNIYESLFGSI